MATATPCPRPGCGGTMIERGETSGDSETICSLCSRPAPEGTEGTQASPQPRRMSPPQRPAAGG